jgi:hypothetical protein
MRRQACQKILLRLPSAIVNEIAEYDLELRMIEARIIDLPITVLFAQNDQVWSAGYHQDFSQFKCNLLRASLRTRIPSLFFRASLTFARPKFCDLRFK